MAKMDWRFGAAAFASAALRKRPDEKPAAETVVVSTADGVEKKSQRSSDSTGS